MPNFMTTAEVSEICSEPIKDELLWVSRASKIVGLMLSDLWMVVTRQLLRERGISSVRFILISRPERHWLNILRTGKRCWRKIRWSRRRGNCLLIRRVVRLRPAAFVIFLTAQRYTHITSEKLIETYNKAHPHS